MTRLEMERRAAEWLGVDLAKLWNIPPAYGSDLNLWPPIYAELVKRGQMPAYVVRLLSRWKSDPGGSVMFETFLLRLTAEDRLRALIAVIGEGK